MTVSPDPCAAELKPAFLTDCVLRRFGTIAKYALLAMVLTRAPRQNLFDKLPFLDAPLQASAGYVLIFGPMAIAAAVWWLAFTFRGPAIDCKQWPPGDRRFAGVVFSFPTFAAAFLSLQFFLLLAPKGRCNDFDRLSYLYDFHLKVGQPEYCMGITDQAASNMPYLLEPVYLQAWFQLAVPVWIGYVSFKLWKRWRGA